MKKKIVLASGVFDLLHPGHLYYLTQAKSLGNQLVVIITSDKTAKLQGKTPLFSQKDRLRLVKALAFVDRVFIGKSGKVLASVVQVNPDIIAVGYDQWTNIKGLKDELLKLGWQGRIKRIKKFGQYSSSKFKNLK